MTKVLDEDGYQWQGPIFYAETIENKNPGGWGNLVIGVYQQDEKDGEKKLLGTYERNYSTNFNNFSYCRKGDRFFALYSPNYTSTRVMEIFPGNGFKDIGGEEKAGGGFCPTDLYIPQVREYIFEQFSVPNRVKDWKNLLYSFPPGTRITERYTESRLDRVQLYYPDGKEIRAYNGKFDVYKRDGVEHKNYRYDRVYGPEKAMETVLVEYPPTHAFVAGCYWGDDSSWKIQYIDVSRIDEGIIKRDERFGYIELPSNLSLKKAINIGMLEDGGNGIDIAINLRFDIRTGVVSIWDNALYGKIEAGRKALKEESDKEPEYAAKRKSYDEELQRRWKEQETEIRKTVQEMGGIIR